MRLWIDDTRPAPEGYVWIKSVQGTKICCCQHLSPDKVLHIEVMSLDHDSGDYQSMGGDYIELLKWLEEKQHTENWVIPTIFQIHSQNPVGRENMRSIIQHNGWREIN